MNSFVERFATNSATADIRKAKEMYGEDEDGSSVMWGSEAGFGTLARGVPNFTVPGVTDVSSHSRCYFRGATLT